MKRTILVFTIFTLMLNILSTTIFAEVNVDLTDEIEIVSDFNEMLKSGKSITGDNKIDEINLNESESEISLDDNFTDNEVLVTLTDSESALNKNYQPSDFSGINVENIYVISSYNVERNNNVLLKLTLSTKDKLNVINTIDVLNRDNRVLNATPNHIFIVESEPVYQTDNIDDSVYSINATDTPEDKEARANSYTYSCCAKKYIDSYKNTTVKIGIVDTGIYNNIDISNKVVQYVDCTNNNSTVYSSPIDLHGSQVANVIARDQVLNINKTHTCGENACAGTCPNIQLYSLKVYQSVNSVLYITADYFCNSIQYAIDNDIDILNFSIRVTCNGRNTNIDNMINQYQGLIVCSAGNKSDENLDLQVNNDVRYPMDGEQSKIIVVGACDVSQQGIFTKWNNSSFGQATVDLFAPGYSINFGSSISDYAECNGTSIAAPRVAGAAAILKTINPNITAEEMKYYILAGVDQYSSLSQYCVTGGSLNIYRSAKMLIADLAYENKTVFSGHFTRTDKLQIAAYCQVDNIQTKCYAWTYDSATNTFSDPEHIFTNNSFALEYAPYGAYNMHRSVAGDFDGDGLDEICTLYDYQNYIFIQGRDYYVHPTNYLIGADVHNFTGRVVALDYDNDGKDEIAALYEEKSAWGHTKLYVWDFSGTKTGMSVTQRIVYDSGAGNYQATYATHRVASGDFDGDGYEEMGVVYYYPQTGKYSLQKFDISNSGATYTSLIFQQNNIDATKVTGRVVGCNYNGGSTDEILCLYDNNAQINNSLKIQGFYLENTNNSWNATFTYTNEHLDANNMTHLLVAGYFTNDGYEDSVIFFHLVDQNLSDNILDDKTRILICPNAYSCYNLIWDPKL